MCVCVCVRDRTFLECSPRVHVRKEVVVVFSLCACETGSVLLVCVCETGSVLLVCMRDRKWL